MRIISGIYRGLRLRTLKGGNLRPTTDQLRETLFDVLGPSVEGATFLMPTRGRARWALRL